MQILYIMGRGHNGSTVVDLILGNHSSVQSVGELSSGLRHGANEICSCGKYLPECEIWGTIINEFDNEFPETKLIGYAKMLGYMDRFYRMPQILSHCLLPSWVNKQYKPMTDFLFDSIAKRGQSPIVVDSSKEFSRGAFFLSRFPKNAKVIYLVRDGRAIMWSYLKRFRKEGTFNFMRKKRKFKQAWPIMSILIATFVVSEMLAITLKLFYGNRILTVRYEDLCENPKAELARIGEFAGVDMSELGQKVENGVPLKIGHNIGGNAMRRSDSGDFTFKPDYVWKESLPRSYGRMYNVWGFIHAWANKYKK